MIIPAPRHLDRQDGSFALTAGTTLHADETATPAAEALRRDFGPATGFPFAAAGPDGADIRIDTDPTRLSPQGYRLVASADGVRITGGDAAGAFYGVQALRQLLPNEIFSVGRVDRGWEVPAVTIEDEPRCRWRGTMLDVARHFPGKDFVLRLLDLLALHRLNVLHLHLTDDQGWRIEIPSYPRLAEISAWRSETLVGHGRAPASEQTYDGTPHGGYYTQADLREIVTYAAERFITVVPEVDMPGHMQSVLAAYPELGNTDNTVSVRTTWGISSQVLSMNDNAVRFCRDVLADVVELFPSQFVHCGGDEVPKDEWRASAAAQQRIRDLGLADEQQLQSWFTRNIAEFLSERGRRFLGWDEVLEGGGPRALPDDLVVVSWRNEDGGIEAARAGLDVVMAPQSHLYFDHYQSANTDAEPLAIGGHTPLEKVYSYEPVPAQLADDADAAAHVLGAQCQLWTEYVPTIEHAEYMLFPRLCAFAETVWRDQPDGYDTFLDRLRPHLARLDTLGVHYRPLDKA